MWDILKANKIVNTGRETLERTMEQLCRRITKPTWMNDDNLDESLNPFS
jgi:hypothetical protein